MIHENSIGWAFEDGMQVAYKEEFAFLNCCRHPDFKTPIWKKKDVLVLTSEGDKE